MLPLLTALALAEPCETWAAHPAVELAPVRQRPALRHRELMAAVSSGRGASPMYRSPWSRMDADLALQAHGFDPVLLSDSEASRYKDLSVVAATMAAERYANERIDDSDVLSGVRMGVRTVIGPNLVLRREPEGLELAANQQPMHRYPKHTRARLSEPGLGQRPSTLRLGAGTSLVDFEEEDLQTDIAVAWRAYVLAERWGLDAFRVAVDVADLQPSQRNALSWSGAWNVQVRERLVDGVTATGELRSVQGSWMPSEARGGLNVQFLPENNRWLLRSTYSYTLPGVESAEHRVDLRVVYNGRWNMPTSPRRWPKGQPVGAEPTWFAETPARGPVMDPIRTASCGEPGAPLAAR